jgi:diguanylate cyclase (GGDEF)-like protein
MNEDIATSLARDRVYALLFVDLDHFKKVNDGEGGHPRGDACLQKIVDTIAGVMGRRGSLYRWGGDEFAVLLPDCSSDEAMPTADRIRQSVEDAGREYGVTASIGVNATNLMSAPSASEFLAATDLAMYASKNGGKNRVTVWSKALTTAKSATDL